MQNKTHLFSYELPLYFPGRNEYCYLAYFISYLSFITQNTALGIKYHPEHGKWWKTYGSYHFQDYLDTGDHFKG